MSKSTAPSDDQTTAGEPTVLIGGKPAARLGDVTAQGGVIITGSATVLIGLDNQGEVADTPDSPPQADPPVQPAPEEVPTPTDPSSQPDPTVQKARKHIGSEDWAYEADRPPYPPDTNKCNLFVYEVLNNSGKPVPMMERRAYGVIPRPDHLPLAGQWADPSVEIPGWEVVKEPRPGDVAAIASDYSDASGHVGIVSGSGSTISATGERVVENDWGFRPGQKPTFRRYVGP